MIFNLWRRYPKRKPKESGYYLCSISQGLHNGVSVNVLYYKKREGKWIDIHRQTMFDGYVVYRVCRAPIPDNRVYFDSLCERTDEVTAWKMLPKGYRSKRCKN